MARKLKFFKNDRTLLQSLEGLALTAGLRLAEKYKEVSFLLAGLGCEPLIFLLMVSYSTAEPRWLPHKGGGGKITYTFSANTNEFPFRFRLTHPPRLLVPRKTEY
jgi:hypothetical protein